MICIYCLEDKSPDSFKRREHVMPQCFGRFNPDNLILYNQVCDQCNDYFGKRLELFLGRDTAEAIERLRHGFKPKEPLKKRKRLKSKIAEGEWKGVIVVEKYSAETGSVGLEKVLQVGFFNKYKQEYDFFEPHDIPTEEKLREAGYETKDSMIWLIAGNEDELDSLIDLLGEKGIKISSKDNLIKQDRIGEKIVVETEVTIDRVIYRALSKIAFNYIAYVAGKDFILSRDFDGIRRFIRYDDGKSENYFAVNIPPILHDDQILAKFGIKTTEGHLIVAEWRKSNVISKLSLFNTSTYLIRLCDNYSGIWRPIKSGHHFDIESKQVNKLFSLSKRLLA